MSIEAKSIEDALELLKALCVDWVTVNKIENSLWDIGVAFFDRTYCRVAYYDDVNHELSIIMREDIVRFAHNWNIGVLE